MDSNEELTVAHTPGEPAFPRPFGRYELLDCIGAGGMGSVYRARPVAGGPEVALKTPLAELLALPAVRERFYREYQALERFRHPGFAPVLDFGQHGDAYYFTMVYVRGTPLSDSRPAEVADAVRLTLALADAMQHAHDHGVVHRDLKPANIIVTPESRPVVVDFGIALDITAISDDRLTVGGKSIGTRPYMPPEQFAGELQAMGTRSDIYSLGVVLYWMLLGRPPFLGKGTELARQVLAEPPVPPSDIAPWIDRRVSDAVVRALAKQPADRFASMADFAAALSSAVGAASPAAPGTASAVRFDFVGIGTTAPADTAGRLYLDVGNDVRAGVLDHHHGGGIAHSATRLVTLQPQLAQVTTHAAGSTATIVMHEDPDLDCAAASRLAASLLTGGALPPGAAQLADYLDRVDSGAPMFTLRRPFTLYAAYMLLARRLADELPDPAARWNALIRGGHQLIDHVLANAGAKPLDAVNAFDCPVMTKADRVEMTEDAQRYERKLADPATMARRAVLKLPTPWGGTTTAEALLVRNVQDEGDPERCTFFKDWARTDAERCPQSDGFAVLCVWMSRPRPRCIISVRPDSDARLTGLGALLDAAETEARKGTGRERTGPPRPGYDNSDPWYDGRGHHDTIVDSPRSGTALSVEQVESILLNFGAATALPLG